MELTPYNKAHMYADTRLCISSLISVQWMDLASDYGWHLGSVQYLLKVDTHS